MLRRHALLLAARGSAGALMAAGTADAVDVTPGTRAGHALAWHGGANAVCLVGGDDAAMIDRRERPWLWDGRAWRRPATGLGPDTASLLTAAADPDRRSIWTFGGFAVLGVRQYGPPVGELWELDASLTWRKAAADGPHPGPRHHHAMAFDARRGRLVVYGGIDAAGGWPVDVWEWDRARWHRIPAAGGPGERAHHAMAYDAARGRVVLRGGTRSDRVRPTDTWEWDGTAWRQVATGGPGPGGGYRMAYDEARRVTVLFGGDTCVWDGTAWTKVATPSAPPGRNVHAIAYDPVRARIVVHGGTIGRDNAGDTWEWDGAAWRPVSGG